MTIEEFLTVDNAKFILPIVIAVTTFITAIVTFVLTSFFTIYKDKMKSNAENRAYFEYGEHNLQFPITQEAMKFHGEGLILFGENGNKFKNKSEQERFTVAFMILHNRTANNLLNVRIKTVYTGKNEITEEFVLPYWNNEEAIYLFQSDFDSSSHLSTNDELTVEFTTKTFEKLRFSFKVTKNGRYREVFEKRYFRFIWIKMINYTHSDFFSYQKLKIEDTDK